MDDRHLVVAFEQFEQFVTGGHILSSKGVMARGKKGEERGAPPLWVLLWHSGMPSAACASTL